VTEGAREAVFVIDNVLLLWARGLLCVFREIEEAAAQEALREERAVRQELSELYAALEKREVTDEVFAAREGELLALLDKGEPLALEAQTTSAGAQTGGGA
jgi:hypothetical protein